MKMMCLQLKRSNLNLVLSILILLPLPSYSFLSVDGNYKARLKLQSHKMSKLHRSLPPPFSAASRTCTSLRMIEGYESIMSAYSNALVQYPIVTKGCSGLVLCGISDIIAQMRGFQAMTNSVDATSRSRFTINYLRLARFAIKGVFGTLIWSCWYDLSDSFYSAENISRILIGWGMQDVDVSSINTFRIFMLMSTEQFVACPVIYGLWEIPVATIMNGASISKIPAELNDKLVPMLIDNFKIWTPANIFIYNAPVEFRPVMANICDILWQSIVSDFAADCGVENKQNDIDRKPLDVFDDQERSVVVRDQDLAFAMNVTVGKAF